MASLAVERSRGLLAAGLFSAADRELADAADQAAAQQLSYTAADAAQVRAEAALLAGQPDAAAQWAADAAGQFRQRGNARRTAIAALTGLRASLAAGGDPATVIATRARRWPGGSATGAGRRRPGGRLTAARAMIAVGRPGRPPGRGPAGRPGRIDRLDTRLLWRLTWAELATATGQPRRRPRATAGLTALHRHRAQFAASTCRPAPRCTGRTWPGPGWPRGRERLARRRLPVG